MRHENLNDSDMGHGHFLNSTGRHEHFLNSTGRHEHFLKSTCKIRTPTSRASYLGGWLCGALAMGPVSRQQGL